MTSQFPKYCGGSTNFVVAAGSTKKSGFRINLLRMPARVLPAKKHGTFLMYENHMDF